jgi:hypothetical protein
MAQGERDHADSAPSRDRCSAAGGCDYLRALSTIEQLAGFDWTARQYEEMAARCEERGCWISKAASPDRSGEMEASFVKPFLLDPGLQSGKRDVGPRCYPSSCVVPFSRSSVFDSASDGDGNFVERRDFKLGSVKAGQSLNYLHEYWRSLRATTSCEFSDLEITHLVRADIIGKLHIVDVSSADPDEFRFELYGYSIPLRRMEKPRAHPVRIWADSTLRDYNTTRMTAIPRLQRVRALVQGVIFHYTRLILPFFDEHDRVVRLAVAIQSEPGDGVVVSPCND